MLSRSVVFSEFVVAAISAEYWWAVPIWLWVSTWYNVGTIASKGTAMGDLHPNT